MLTTFLTDWDGLRKDNIISGEAVTRAELPNLLHRGKVRDTFDLGDGLLLMVSTDRISAFDVVLPTVVPEKGVILSNLSCFWFNLTSEIMPNHLVAEGTDHSTLTRFLPGGIPWEIARRSMVVRRAERVDVECVVRGYITGSAWAEYQKAGTVHGQPTPSGLSEGDRFPLPIFTPTTKAEEGHDLPLSLEELRSQVGSSMATTLEQRSLSLYQTGHDYALAKGIILADTKVEFGMVGDELILIDELFTPDSSRFWDSTSYQPGHSLPNFDKQFVRDWLVESGWDREPPAPELPLEVVEKTRERYFEAYKRLTGKAVP